jgi:hypothetical protein
MKAFQIALTFVVTMILFTVIANQVFNGATFLKFLFAFSLASVVVLIGFGMLDTFLPPQKKPHDED